MRVMMLEGCCSREWMSSQIGEQLRLSGRRILRSSGDAAEMCV